jgi:predicted Rossmann fold flavoprotein
LEFFVNVVNVWCHEYDVIVLGAGAAGLMCALTAAARGKQVLVLEKSNKVGKKILMSGGGRCNFTNEFVEPENFISSNPHFCTSALNRYTPSDFIAMVERHRIKYEVRKHNQLFCLDSAKDILNMLLQECETVGVEIKDHCDVKAITSLKNNIDNIDSMSKDSTRRYSVNGVVGVGKDHETFILDCHSIVIATGALSIPKLGGSGFGYEVAKQFAIGLTQRRAGLVPFMFSGIMKPVCERLSGLALEVEVQCNDQVFTENLLFTHRGISGPAILQISNYWCPGDEISINLLPGVDANAQLLVAKYNYGNILLRTFLSKKLAKSLVIELQNLWWQEFSERPLAEFSDKQLINIGSKVNHMILKPSATEGYRTAEVTLGGVDTNEISSKTMEAKQQPGLYFVGEVLDVTGHLGGFNFQWAWASGYSAGTFV